MKNEIKLRKATKKDVKQFLRKTFIYVPINADINKVDKKLKQYIPKIQTSITNLVIKEFDNTDRLLQFERDPLSESNQLKLLTFLQKNRNITNGEGYQGTFYLDRTFIIDNN